MLQHFLTMLFALAPEYGNQAVKVTGQCTQRLEPKVLMP
jgi:hypothetical protein